MKPVGPESTRPHLRPALIAVAAGLVAAAACLPSLRNGLVWDDAALVVHGRAGPAAAFGKGFWQESAESVGDPYYRPLVNSSLALERALAGKAAWHFHLANILLHAAVVGLLAWLAGIVAGSAAVGGIAAILFGLHPLLADSVAYVSGRTDLLAGLGLVVGCVGLVWQRTRPGGKGIAAVLAGFAVAVFSKESGLLFLVPAAGALFLWREQKGGQRRDRVVLAGLAVIAAGYLAARWAVLGSLVGMRPAGTPGQNLGLMAGEFGRGLVRFFWPVGQNLFEWRGPESGRLDAYALVTLGYLLVPVGLARARQGRSLLGAWLWGLAFLFPFAALSQFGPTGRLLYLPGMGLVLLVVLVAQGLVRSSRAGQRVAVAAGLIAAAAMVPLLWQRIGAWRTDLALFRRMTREAPGYAAGHYNLGNVLLARADSAGAAGAFSRALALDSNLAQAGLNLGALRQQQGAFAEAAALYRRAIRARPAHAPARVNFGIVLHKAGDRQGAVDELRRALELDPRSVGAAYNLAWLFHLDGQSDSARRYAGLALQLEPGNPRVRGLVERLRAGR